MDRMMSAGECAELERYLHEHIPLSRAMQVSVVSVHADGVTLRAPLAPNINHQDTVFGGSASALAILAGWSLLHTRLGAAGIASRLVIQRNSVHYDLPIAGPFTARSFLRTPDAWEPFTRMLARKGRARLTVSCALEYDGQSAGRLEGEFVALGRALRAEPG
ncbi:MAG: YiiD C-terminal domain-containing protein [Steroidobacteraceae bacterium]